MTAPIYTPDEARDRETFLALMWALSYPGRIHALPSAPQGDALAQIGAALLDLETSYFTTDAALADALARTGARALPPDEAAYHFYPTCDDAALEAIGQAKIGTMLRPDESATLIIGCAFASGSVFRWTGPGIQTEADVRLGGLPARFWSLRKRAVRYPLGWDVYLIDHARVMGLPRTTAVSSGGE
jgi:alpha-D-ribose 1-methylphosphonate 5-triphosphate synthase subunit PhnH